MKQTITFLFLLVALLLPGDILAQTYSVVSEGLTLNFTVSGTEATITGTPDKVIRTGDPSLPYGYDLNNGGILKIPATVNVGSNTYTVTTIGKQAFLECNINSLTLPATLKEIKENAFGASRCDYAFDDLVIPASVQIIGENAFFNQPHQAFIIRRGLANILPR